MSGMVTNRLQALRDPLLTTHQLLAYIINIVTYVSYNNVIPSPTLSRPTFSPRELR
jgi:hypothetical protein